MGLRRIPRNEAARARKRVEERIRTMEMLLDAAYNPITGLFYKHCFKEQVTKYWDMKGKLVKTKPDAFNFIPRQQGKSFLQSELWRKKIEAQMQSSMGLTNELIRGQFDIAAMDTVTIKRLPEIKL